MRGGGGRHDCVTGRWVMEALVIVALVYDIYEVIWVHHARMGDGRSRFRESQHCESMEREGVGGRGERGGGGRGRREEQGCGTHV